MAAPAPGSPELRVYLLVRDLQRQFAAYLGTPTRARGYPPFEGEHSLIVEVAPALAIERVTDLALRAVPTVEPGILFVERQFGVLEVHGPDLADVERAGQAILAGLHADASDQLRPKILFSDVINDITDRQAVIINRNRAGSMVIPGDTLLVCEVTPALFAAVAANEAERAAARRNAGGRLDDRGGGPHLHERRRAGCAAGTAGDRLSAGLGRGPRAL